MRAVAALLLAVPAAAQEPGWEARVAELAPALRACLADRPGAMVVEAAMRAGLVEARLLLPDGGAEGCVADPAAGSVTSRRALSGDARDRAAPRAFMLDRRCVDARRVVDAGGGELGWLAYPACG